MIPYLNHAKNVKYVRAVTFSKEAYFAGLRPAKVRNRGYSGRNRNSYDRSSRNDYRYKNFYINCEQMLMK